MRTYLVPHKEQDQIHYSIIAEDVDSDLHEIGSLVILSGVIPDDVIDAIVNHFDTSVCQ